MNRAAVIEQLKAAQETLNKFWRSLNRARQTNLLRTSTRRESSIGQPAERPNKGNKAIEREIIASFQVAQSFGFRGDFRAWEHLRRIHE
jgi:hypothetical protein